MACETYPDGSSAVKNRIRQGRRDRLGTQRHEILGWPQARADPTSGTQRLVLYLVSTTPSGNVRASTRLRFTQLSRAVKNGVPPPTRTGWLTIGVLVDQPGPHGRCGECGAADVHGAAVVGLEPGDLGARVPGDQAAAPAHRAR